MGGMSGVGGVGGVSGVGGMGGNATRRITTHGYRDASARCGLQACEMGKGGCGRSRGVTGEDAREGGGCGGGKHGEGHRTFSALSISDRFSICCRS